MSRLFRTLTESIGRLIKLAETEILHWMFTFELFFAIQWRVSSPLVTIFLFYIQCFGFRECFYCRHVLNARTEWCRQHPGRGGCTKNGGLIWLRPMGKFPQCGQWCKSEIRSVLIFPFQTAEGFLFSLFFSTFTDRLSWASIQETSYMC